MFIKFMLFYLLWRITGSPILAILVLLVIFYFVERRYIGLLPSVTKPIKRRMQVAELQKQLQVNPHDMPARLELAQIKMEGKQYQQALHLLGEISASMQAEAEVECDKGICYLALGRLEEGEELTRASLAKNESIRYGEPWLRLATAFISANPTKALAYLEEFQRRNFSSCESWYQMAILQTHFGDKGASRKALAECLRTYRSLPRFRKRKERRWATLARFRILFGG
jgi:tetratricopeptide (TPR) repeat protein